LSSGITEPKAAKKKVKVTKNREPQQPLKKSDVKEPPGYSTADASSAPIDVKTKRKYLRMVLWTGLSAAFLGFGTVACGLLWQEENAGTAIALFLAGLAGAAGCIFFFYLFLREISPTARGPFISTLQ
jgi:hypothetical protein